MVSSDLQFFKSVCTSVATAVVRLVTGLEGVVQYNHCIINNNNNYYNT